MRSLYDLLGIAPDADPEEIRSAYLREMKRFHPDASGGGPSAGDAAARLNQAFAVLRDSASRERYDAELERIRRASRGRSGTAPPPRPAPGLKALVGAAALSALLLALVYWNSQDGAAPDHGRKATPESLHEAGPATAPPAVSDADVKSALEELAWFIGNGSPADAGRYSEKCFASLAERPNHKLFDHCVAFDSFASRWAAEASIRRGSPAVRAFAPEVMTRRHIAAARLISADAVSNIERIGEIESRSAGLLARLAYDRSATSAARDARR